MNCNTKEGYDLKSVIWKIIVMCNSEMLVLVDEHDNEIGQEEKISVHKKGKLHRAFSVFIFRENNGSRKILLQQRNVNKYHCGNLWTNTCCSHPRIGEDIVKAGERRLDEEMLFTTRLFHIDSFHYKADCKNGFIEHELDHVLVGRYQDKILEINPEEVQDFRWITIDDVNQELIQYPNIFTPWFAKALIMVEKNIKKVNDLLFSASY